MPAGSLVTTIDVSIAYYRYEYCCEYSLLLPCQQVLLLRLFLWVPYITAMPAGSSVLTISVKTAYNCHASMLWVQRITAVPAGSLVTTISVSIAYFLPCQQILPFTTIPVSTDSYCHASRFFCYDYFCEYSLLLPCQQVLSLRLSLWVQLIIAMPAGSHVTTIAVSTAYYCHASRFFCYDYFCEYRLLLPCQQVLLLRLFLWVQLITAKPAGSSVTTISVSKAYYCHASRFSRLLLFLWVQIVTAMPAGSSVTTFSVNTDYYADSPIYQFCIYTDVKKKRLI